MCKESPEEVVRRRLQSPTSRDSDSVGLWRGPRIHIPEKLPDDSGADAAGTRLGIAGLDHTQSHPFLHKGVRTLGYLSTNSLSALGEDCVWVVNTAVLATKETA